MTDPRLALLDRFYAAFQRRDAAEMAACYHPEATFTDPVFELRGPAVGAMWRMLCERGQDLRVAYGDLALDGEEASAAWEAWYTFRQSGRRVHNVIRARFRFRDGLIVAHEDRFGFWRWARQALGGFGAAWGWLPAVRERVRAAAAHGLALYRGPRLTYIGGATALIEWRGLRLLTDPTFDAAGTSYPTPADTLRRTTTPAIAAEALGPIDAVLLSHDHHFDNLDTAGRALLPRAGRVLTTTAGAERLGGNAAGLAPWETAELRSPWGDRLRVTATPARHGPAHADRGPVIGFHLAFADAPDDGLYLSGDTVWYEGVAEAAERFRVAAAVLFVGAAKVRAVGDFPLTFTAADAVQAAHAFRKAWIVPLHFEGWEHFSESRAELERAYAAARIGDRLRWPVPGKALALLPRV